MNRSENNKSKPFCSAKRYLLENMAKALDSFENMAGIQETVDSVMQADKIFVYGVGRSGMVGRSFAMRLVQLGLKSHFIGESTTPIVSATDMVIIISRTGETYSAIQTANIVRRMGARLLVVTEKKGSKLAHAGTMVHVMPTVPRDKKTNLAPLGTLFEITALLYFDCIVAEILEKTGESEESMRARHAIWV